MRAGEEPGRLFELAAWRESSLFSERERAALALTDAATVVSDGHVPDDVCAGDCRLIRIRVLGARTS
jgi:alkylhydroperoxidase family enzyme